MHRPLTILLVIATAFASLSFGGMVVMDSGMAAHDMASVNCLPHCLEAATSIVDSTQAVVPLQVIIAIAAIVLLSANVWREPRARTVWRRDQFFDQLFLHRQLATIVIRD